MSRVVLTALLALALPACDPLEFVAVSDSSGREPRATIQARYSVDDSIRASVEVHLAWWPDAADPVAILLDRSPVPLRGPSDPFARYDTTWTLDLGQLHELPDTLDLSGPAAGERILEVLPVLVRPGDQVVCVADEDLRLPFETRGTLWTEYQGWTFRVPDAQVQISGAAVPASPLTIPREWLGAFPEPATAELRMTVAGDQELRGATLLTAANLRVVWRLVPRGSPPCIEV